MYIYLFILIIYICVVFIQYDIDSMYISYTVTNNMYHTNLHQPNRRPRSTHLLIGHILQLMWFFGQFVRDDHESLVFASKKDLRSLKVIYIYMMEYGFPWWQYVCCTVGITHVSVDGTSSGKVYSASLVRCISKQSQPNFLIYFHVSKKSQLSSGYLPYLARAKRLLLSSHRYVAYSSDVGESLRPVTWWQGLPWNGKIWFVQGKHSTCTLVFLVYKTTIFFCFQVSRRSVFVARWNNSLRI